MKREPETELAWLRDQVVNGPEHVAHAAGRRLLGHIDALNAENEELRADLSQVRSRMIDLAITLRDAKSGPSDGPMFAEEHAAQLIAEFAAVKADNERLRTMLRDVEWAGTDDDGYSYCLYCYRNRRSKYDGKVIAKHAADCALTEALAAPQKTTTPSSLNEAFGKWPGGETDVELATAMKKDDGNA